MFCRAGFGRLHRGAKFGFGLAAPISAVELQEDRRVRDGHGGLQHENVKGLSGFIETINESLVLDLAGGNYIAQLRNVVLVGGTGTGKTHLAMAIARSCIRAGSRGRFFNTVDLVNRLEAEGRTGRQGGLADYLTRLDFVILDELGYLPFAQTGGQLLFHLISRLY